MSQLTLSLFDTTALSGLTLGASAGPRFREDPAEAAPAAEPEAERVPAHAFRLLADRALARGWKARAADNLAAIRLMQAIEGEDRHATPDEQDRLARFVGFGAGELANTLFRRQDEAFRPGWEDLGHELEQLVSPAEMAALARSTQYAHYTPEFMVRAVWAALGRMGFAGGTVLEPGCGTGLFLAMMPEKVAARSAATGIEMDPTTARIAKLLYPDAWIRTEDFTKARLAETFDLAVGNPPFSDRTVRADDPAGRLGLSLHDYFIARGIERLKPGGLAAFVTSRHTMDKVDPTAREHIASMADLVGAVRMPQGAMLAVAGTEVVVDVLFFQRRRAEQAPGGAAWSDLVEALPAEDGEPALAVNRYFAEHPGMVLGLHGRTTSPFGVVYTCHPCPTVSLEADLGAALEHLPAGIYVPAAPAESTPVRPSAAPRVRVGTAAEGATVKEGSYLLVDGALMQVLDGVPERVAVKSATVKEGIFAKHARIILGLIPLRDAIRAVLRAQEANEPWGLLQGRLRSAYQLFVRQFGPVNLTNVSTSTDPKTGEVRETVRRPNLQPFLDDPDVWLVSSIEQYDEDAGTARMGPIFHERVIHPPAEPVITCAADALAVTLHEVGHVDVARVAEMLGRPREQVIAELGEAVFLNPQATTPEAEAWETADAYLSGPVRTKLAAAAAAAALDPRYARNVDALRRVQPEDLKPSEITARLGAPWIPAQVVQAFSQQVIGVETRVRHTREVACWSLDVDAFEGLAAATSEWGTARRHAGELLHDALNASVPQIYDTVRDANGERRELNASETEAAKEKLLKIKQAFERWVWTDVERTGRLARLYNDAFNNLVPRAFDGRHLQLPGASSAIKLRDVQKRVVWRIVAAGGTYIAHAVGTGKTFSMAAAVMEQKRLGLITKAMMTVPGHCLAQASREFLLLYPNARILVADETNFTKDKRQRFLARAATATWDCIIITHSAFRFIPAPADFERGLIEDALRSYSSLLEKVGGDDRLTRKRIERMKEGLQDKLEALAARKDDLLTIAEMGVDQLIVDEAQEFRKLSFATNMSGLKGVAPDGSQRAWDLHAKARFIAQRQPTRPLVLASGTPITNTLGEMFTIQRLMQPEVLEERGIHEFDAWASSFGDTRTELELQPSGSYKPVTRFAEFVNVPELISMFRSIADVVLMGDLRQHLRLPAIRTGKRQIVTAKASPAFRAYQKVLAERIRLIEARKGPPQKGQDILLSVITDGRHAAIDTRFVLGCDTEADPHAGNEPGNKLNALIANVHRIWLETAGNRYLQPDTGMPYPLPGAAQMVFSDLGTEAAEGKRGFSAYLWIRDELVRLGVPREQVAFMQDFKKSEAKQKLFAAVNGGKVRVLPAKLARFDDELAQVYGITWTDDLFVPAGEDGRTTDQVEQYLAAQGEWLAGNLPEGGDLAELDQYGDAKLPKGAERTYGKPRKGDQIACYVCTRTGEVKEVGYRLPEPRRGMAGTGTGEKPAPKPRADITSKGVDMIGALRTDALHQALRESAIPDQVLMGLLVLGLGAQNVQVHSGAERKGYGWREGIADRLVEGGVLTQDLDVLRAAAREMLVEVLSCRTDMSQSGMNARYAGVAIGADALLPNMATADFLGCLSKQAMERTASANGVAPRNTGKATRAAMIAQTAGKTFIHPAALFPPTAAELRSRRHRGELMIAEQPENNDEDNSLPNDEDLDGTDAARSGTEDDMADDGTMPPPVTEAAGQQPAA